MRTARCLALCLFVATGCLRADVFVFRPKPAPEGAGDLMETSEVPAHLRHELVDEIISSDGVKVSAWLLSHEDDDGTPTARHTYGVLYCHGNNTHIGTTVARLDALWALGYTVLAFDARGYGKTALPATGQTQVGVFADAMAARDYFVSRSDLGLSPSRVGLYGRSLGSAVCMDVATKTDAPALVLESPIGALQAMIDDSSSLDTPSDWWIDSTMDNVAMIKDFKGALLVMHGEEDDFVSPEYGEQIYEQATATAHRKLWLVPGADHSDLPCAQHHVDHPKGGGCTGGINPRWQEETVALFDGALN